MTPPTALHLSPGQILRELADDLGFQDKDLRIIFDAEQRSLEKWRSGEALPQKGTRRRLNELHQLHGHLGQTFTSYEGARAWLRAPSRYLAGLTPLQVLRSGDVDDVRGIERVQEALDALDAGVFL